MTTTSTPTKTQGTNLFTLATIATAAVSLGSAIDVSGKFAGTAFVHFGRTATTALTAQVKFRLEASSKATLDGQWYSLYEWTTANGLTAAVGPSIGTTNAGQAVVALTVTTSVVAGSLLFLKNGTLANSEFARVVSVVGSTSATVEDNLLNAQTSGVAWTQAEWWAIPLDLSAVGRIRLVVDTYSGPSGQTVAVEGFLVTLDSIGTV